MQEQSAFLDSPLKPSLEQKSPVIPDVVCPRCASLAPPQKVEDRGTYMVYKRRCPTSLPTIDGMKTCGPIANIGTHEEFQKLAPANMQITQDQWRQLMAALVANVAVKSLQGAGV